MAPSPYYGFAYDRQPLDYLKTLDKKLRRQIAAKILQLAANPHPATAKVVQGMVDGEERVYRIRSGDYRIIGEYALHNTSGNHKNLHLTALALVP